MRVFSRRVRGSFGAACVATVVAALAVACSSTDSTTTAKTGGAAAATGKASTPAAQFSACDKKWVQASDVSDLLTGDVTVKPLPGDAQTCMFETPALSSVNVSVRPGLGNTTIQSWKSGAMNVPATAVAGLGDSAVWVDSLSELVASKNDQLCDIAGRGLTASADVLQKKFGAMCTKIWAGQ